MSDGYGANEFWKQYSEYVDEVFHIHQRATEFLLADRNIGSVLDIGCGRIQESRRLFDLKDNVYLGVDKEFEDIENLVKKLDYRESFDKLLKTANTWRPETFISLFSTELTGNPGQNEEFYHELFNNVESINLGIVSGFYYSGKKNQTIVGETGGIQSYQSIGDVIESDTIRETRLLLRNPSKMFGSDVVEVWRLFERK